MYSSLKYSIKDFPPESLLRISNLGPSSDTFIPAFFLTGNYLEQKLWSTSLCKFPHPVASDSKCYGRLKNNVSLFGAGIFFKILAHCI